MTPNSRDNVNPTATVTIEAIDRNGDVVDRHQAYGRHEPATQLLDFMLNCEAMFGKLGTKIVRFTCEVAYILLVGMFFLSSERAEASHGDFSYTAGRHGQLVVSGYNTLYPPRPLVQRARPPAPFPDAAAPILYVIKWPPVKSEAERLAEEAYARLTMNFDEPVVVKPFDWHKFWEWTIYSSAGLAAMLFGVLYLVMRRVN